jgi:hypothetical protein
MDASFATATSENTPAHSTTAGMERLAYQSPVIVWESADAMPLTDESREIAIVRAGKLVEWFMAEHDAARRRYLGSSDLADKGDADGALLSAQQAQSLMLRLIRGRSAQQVARMERERGLS